MVGYGRSIAAGADHDLSVAAQSRYLNALLDYLGIDQAILVGHDLGGGVAQIAAVNQPDRCAGLALINSIAYDSWPIPAVKAAQAVPGLVIRTPDALFTRMLGVLLARGHDDPAVARASLEQHARHYLEHDGAAALARQIRALDVRDALAVADQLPELGVPARVVWGLADPFQKAPYGQCLARDWHGSGELSAEQASRIRDGPVNGPQRMLHRGVRARV